MLTLTQALSSVLPSPAPLPSHVNLDEAEVVGTEVFDADTHVVKDYGHNAYDEERERRGGGGGVGCAQQ